ncbi:unnamed protein product [Malus baccata var. baccata]
MATDIICPHDWQFKRVSNKIKDDNRYWPYFKVCIGAIDGTLPYIGRKENTTQNIMTVCDFNMCFTFVWGWMGGEPFGGDQRGTIKYLFKISNNIFMEALRRPESKFPYPLLVSKYYLVDAGYPHMNGYIGPYRGERYHLPDFRCESQPRVKKEIFNPRWTMIRLMRNFPFEKQVQILVALMTLHNFIRNRSMIDQEFQPCNDDEELLPLDMRKIIEMKRLLRKILLIGES